MYGIAGRKLSDALFCKQRNEALQAFFFALSVFVYIYKCTREDNGGNLSVAGCLLLDFMYLCEKKVWKTRSLLHN